MSHDTSTPESTAAKHGLQTSAAAVRALCAALFLQPERLLKVHSFPVAPTGSKTPVPRAHAHSHLLQLDLALHCTGRWIVEGESRRVDGTTLSVFYPRQWHAYEVRALRPGARVLSLKVSVETDWPAITQRVLASHRCRVAHADPLIREWERLIYLSNIRNVSPTDSLKLQALRLAEILCLWPTDNQPAEPVTVAREDFASATLNATDENIEAALRHIEANLNRCVTLGELAQTTHISPRHLSRRFQAVCGQSPHDYIEARRLSIARDLLLQERSSISQIAQTLGFSSVPAFSRWFKTHCRLGPREWQREVAKRPFTTSSVPFA